MNQRKRSNRSVVIAPIIVLVAGPVTLPPANGQSVDESVFVESDGAQLFLEVRGADRNSPVLLYLHGGPGSPLGILSFQAYVGSALEQNYVVAYLHQRGVLRSPMVPDSTQTVSQHVRDVDRVVDRLAAEFGGKRVVLLGHSWGGILALLYAREHESKVAALISVAAPFNVEANFLASYERALEWARQVGNDDAVQALLTVGRPPYETTAGHLVRSTWSSWAHGGVSRNLSMERVLAGTGLAEGDGGWRAGQLRIGEVMYPDVRRINLEAAVRDLGIPLMLVAGRRDAEVPWEDLVFGYDNYGGPKRFLLFDNSHHMVFVDEPDRFVAEVVAFTGELSF
ncbi:MAG: alpha/beta hydrolase [Gemmatimonadota bacterium]|nr:MAG: alpha/beta hydrolase [Gemmatimonadota bacterium]